MEFKETTGTRREAAMTVCAFLNQRGGQVLFGVTQDGAVAGLQVSERTIEELSAVLGRIEPCSLADRRLLSPSVPGHHPTRGRPGVPRPRL